jgi:hypothetical protein
MVHPLAGRSVTDCKADLKTMRDDVRGLDLSNEIENTGGRSLRIGTG